MFYSPIRGIFPFLDSLCYFLYSMHSILHISFVLDIPFCFMPVAIRFIINFIFSSDRHRGISTLGRSFGYLSRLDLNLNTCVMFIALGKGYVYLAHWHADRFCACVASFMVCWIVWDFIFFSAGIHMLCALHFVLVADSHLGKQGGVAWVGNKFSTLFI